MSDLYSLRLQRQRCKACWSADGFDFTVPDAVWSAVLPEPLREHVVCLSCFDDFAEQAGVDYIADLSDVVYFAGARSALVLRVERRAPTGEE